MTVVDSHHHLWDPAALEQPQTVLESSILNRAYLSNHLAEEMGKVGVDYTVYVQGYPQSLEHNEWMFRQADDADFIAGVVAWADLMSPETLAEVLDGLQNEPKFVGIRHIVEMEPDVDWIVRDAVVESLGELARRGIPYDMLVRPEHLQNVLAVLDRIPSLQMVIDHLAKPDIARGGSPGWAEHMAALAQNPRVHCKLSGIITQADWRNWKPSDLRPYVDHAVEVFGWDRIMFGSDWPVCLLAGSYSQVWDSINSNFQGIDQENRAKIFGDNAIRFYRLRT